MDDSDLGARVQRLEGDTRLLRDRVSILESHAATPAGTTSWAGRVVGYVGAGIVYVFILWMLIVLAVAVSRWALQ